MGNVHQDDVRQAYDRWAASYDADRNLTRDLDETVTRETLGRLRLGSVLEIGCGTGKNTALYAHLADRVLALDLSWAMIQKARARLPAGRVTFCLADATQPWPCRDRWADVVACNLVLEHLPDLGSMFSQAARALIDGGRLFVCELHPFRQYLGTVAHFQQGDETVEIPAYVHHVSDSTTAARATGLALVELKEWWHPVDEEGRPPRLLSAMFEM